MNRRPGRIWGWVALAVGLWAAAAWAETTEFVTYYPAPTPPSAENDDDLQVRSLRVGDGYQTLPVPNEGVAVVSDAMAIGVPVPASGTIIPAGALQVVGMPGKSDKVLLEPGAGAGGRMELEVAGNLILSLTAATHPSAIPGTLFSDPDRFLYNSGTENTFLGAGAGAFNVINAATGNTGLGARALGGGGTIGRSNNTAVGRWALANNRQGYDNTAVGADALAANTTGFSNTAVGSKALALASSADYSTLFNVAVGAQALYSAGFSSNENVAIGNQALYSASGNSSRNVAIGDKAGRNTGNINNNVLLGRGASMPGYDSDISDGTPEGSNMLSIQNSITGQPKPLIVGNFASDVVQINGRLAIGSVPSISGATRDLKVDPNENGVVGRDLAELFNSPSSSGPLPAGTIAALGAGGHAVAAKGRIQTLGPTSALPGILMDGSSQKIGPTPEDLNVPGKSAVALLGRVSVQTEGPIQVGDVLVAGPSGKAVRWSPDKSILSYAGLALEVNPKTQVATVLVGHQGLRKVLDSVQDKNRILRGDLNKLKEDLERLKKIRR